MRKTKKRVTAATKLQALARGNHARSKQKQQNTAATKLQALARGKRDRRAATVRPDSAGLLARFLGESGSKCCIVATAADANRL